MATRFGGRTRVSTPVSLWGQNPYKVTGFFPMQVNGVGPITVTASASINTKGAWFEMIASTSDDSNFIAVDVQNGANATATEGFLDIAIGASGSESIIVDNAIGGAILSIDLGKSFYVFPVYVPKGSRVAARLSNAIASRSALVSMTFLKSDLKSPNSLVTLGANVATTRGVNVPNASTFYEVTSSTAQDYQGVIIAVLATGGTGHSNITYNVDVAVGASGSEIVLDSNTFRGSSSEHTARHVLDTKPIILKHIAAGSRLSVRASAGTLSYRDVVLYGIPYA